MSGKIIALDQRLECFSRDYVFTMAVEFRFSEHAVITGDDPASELYKAILEWRPDQRELLELIFRAKEEPRLTVVMPPKAECPEPEEKPEEVFGRALSDYCFPKATARYRK